MRHAIKHLLLLSLIHQAHLTETVNKSDLGQCLQNLKTLVTPASYDQPQRYKDLIQTDYLVQKDKLVRLVTTFPQDYLATTSLCLEDDAQVYDPTITDDIEQIFNLIEGEEGKAKTIWTSASYHS